MHTVPTNLLGIIPVPDLDFLEEEEEKNKVRRYEKNVGIPLISINELEGMMNSGANVAIFDCRFCYEFKKGHINGADNVTTVNGLYNLYLHYKEAWPNRENNIIAFHCEFSHERGPSFAKVFREIDRKINLANYPYIDFPNVYIIRGGFKEIYRTRKDLCCGSYLPMRSNPYVKTGEMSARNKFFECEIKKFYSIPNYFKKANNSSSSQQLIRPKLYTNFF